MNSDDIIQHDEGRSIAIPIRWGRLEFERKDFEIMRLLTWNACRGAYERKVPLLHQLDADIMVVQEIAQPLVANDHVIWEGANPNQGLAVISKPPYEISRLPAIDESPKYVIPISVKGPSSFVLFAVWTLGRRPYPYVRAAAKAIDDYAVLFEKNEVVMLGDFNSNAQWDNIHPADLNHSAMVKRLESYGMVSAYHHHKGVAHGDEPDATFHMYRRLARPYHIDFCFLPRTWANTIEKVEVGTFEHWRPYSDHRPMIISLSLSFESNKTPK